MAETTTIKQGGAWLELSQRTPRTELRRQSIISKMLTVYEPLAERIGEDTNAVQVALLDYAALASRTVTHGGLDFEIARGDDTAEAIASKFEGWLDTAHMALIDQVARALRNLDAPVDADLGPTAITVTDPNV